MTARINEIKMDIDDLNSLLDKASRQKSKDVLNLEIRRLQTELFNLQSQISTNQENKASKPIANSALKCYDIKLNNYAWDQTEDFIKIYVTLNNVQSLPKESVFCNFSDRSMDLHVRGLDNKNYELPINNLCEDINTSKSFYKVKTDMIIVSLAKKSKKNWTCITSVEKRIKAAKATPSVSDPSDPNASLMSLMKKMYEDGDDEMKKTIAKAWTENQDKKTSLGGLPEI
ncbi:hypothetical protein TSAR_000903 [Trichomalopsis sarcophagae]|uniref:Calcyclin-binding protein n=1 Tax=Trichomalopsis sarcophagae TaxID=543379 RepID=A0A232F303_9HYME|nr:hypothetical protein TSAR_000903 [Trichomalopsis sarcophagae]